MPKITFAEKEFQIRDFESFIFWSNIFWGLLKKEIIRARKTQPIQMTLSRKNQNQNLAMVFNH